MERLTLASVQIESTALNFIAQNHKDTVEEVISAISNNKVVVVGMAQNPAVRKARKTLEAKNIEYTFLTYGSYTSKWQQRLAIKLWSGWPTFPQVFIDGKLVGGAKELIEFLKE